MKKWIEATVGGLITFMTLSACEKFSGDPVTQNKNFNAEVIYGEDNRIDWYQETDPHWQDMARSTVALFDKDQLSPVEEGQQWLLQTTPYGLSKMLCEDEPFYQQNRGSFCSGFLIAPDLVVTAGHCLRNAFNCESVRFVFDFLNTAEDSSLERVSADQVYQCAELIHSQANALTGSDFAIARLKRKVTDRHPLLLRQNGRLSATESLTVIGYPSGLPLKLAHEGRVRDLSQPAFFVASLDTYGGNSGSAVFNSRSRLVEGILFNGDTDFVFDTEKKCRVSNHCQETSCRGEDVTRISEIFPYLTPSDLEALHSF